MTIARHVTTLVISVIIVGLVTLPAVAVGAESSPVPSPSAVASAATPAPAVESVESPVALVPVVGYWSADRSISLAALRSAFQGQSKRFTRVLVAEPHLDSVAATLGVEPGPATKTSSQPRILREVNEGRRTLGIVPAAWVRPAVRALGVGEATLFGIDHVRSLDSWPLMLPGPPQANGAAAIVQYDPAAVWTLAAAGDVNLDRDVYRQAVRLGKGPDFPWDGGVGKITSRRCCNEFGGAEITARRAGQAGAIRRLFKSADLAIVNHEGPAPDDFRWNPHGLRFSFDPALEVGLARAGIDIVSLANNHIRDAGSDGVIDSIANVRKVGINTVGAGRDSRAARIPACVGPVERHVCVLAYNDVDPADDATRSRPGAASLDLAQVRADIRRLRRNGADVIVVVPHWGIEYTPSRTKDQRRKAAAMVKSGADVVLGAHSHVVGAMESIRGVPVLYSMGNFIFDLTRFEATLEGVIVELTFHGRQLLQVDLHPTVLIDLSQPNLLDPDSDGRVVLKRMEKASRGLYP